MKEERYNALDGTFAAFNFATLQSFKTLFLLMDRNGMNQGEFSEYLKLKTVAMTATDKRSDAKRCPICDSPMRPEFVNVSPRTMTGDDSKIVYTCINQECMHQIFE